MDDPRDVFISQVVPNRSFAEVGGLWGTVSEKVSVAHRSGAGSLTMIDVTPEGDELWRRFEDRVGGMGVPAVRCVSADVHRFSASPERPTFDVVHCSGILYHVPDPIGFLVALRRITARHLVLTSAVTAARLENEAGVLQLAEASALFVPALGPAERTVLRAHWHKYVGDGALGVTCEVPEWRLDDFAPWWWLPTVPALRGLCEVAGFDVEDGAPLWDGNAYTLRLARRGA